MTHETDVYGTRDVETGNFEEGIRKLMTRLPGNRQPHSVRTPILIDLCVAHTMERNMSEATQYCDQATESGWSAGLAYNNRGVLNIAKGDYESAIGDFQMAIKSRGADAVAKRNLSRSQTRLADIRSQHKEQRVAVVLGVQ